MWYLVYNPTICPVSEQPSPCRLLQAPRLPPDITFFVILPGADRTADRQVRFYPANPVILSKFFISYYEGRRYDVTPRKYKQENHRPALPVLITAAGGTHYTNSRQVVPAEEDGTGVSVPNRR